MLRMSATVRFCLAFCRASRKFGMSRAAMMPMMATTMSSSISVKPFCRLRMRFNISWVSSPQYLGNPACGSVRSLVSRLVSRLDASSGGEIRALFSEA